MFSRYEGRLFCFFLLIASSVANAEIWHVNNAAVPGPRDGTSWDRAFLSVQEGIDAAAGDGGGDVWVASGSYDEARTLIIGSVNTGAINLVSNVHLYGGFAGTETAREQREWNLHITTLNGSTSRGGAPAYHVVYCGNVAAGYATLDGFVITGGYGDDGSNNNPRTRGGGMHCAFSAPTVRNCIFVGNGAKRRGGAMYNVDSSPQVVKCQFNGNTAERGGAVYNEGDSWVEYTACTFADNSATLQGGAVYDGTFTPPAAGYITQSRFAGNTANEGGAFYFSSYCELQVTNCVIEENTATLRGGAMFVSAFANPAMVNNTLAENMSAEGGGIYRASAEPTSILNCILWGNAPQQIAPPDSCLVTYSDVQGGYGGPFDQNLDADPLLDPDRRITTGSPCIDTGTRLGAPPVDILGVPRPQGFGVDMGAYEYTDAVVVAGFQADPTDGSAPLAVHFEDVSWHAAGAESLSWEWNFGDSESSTEQHPTHTYVNPGMYTVALTFRCSLGESTETKVNYINVRGPGSPTADFTAAPLAGPAPLSVTFSDASLPGLSPITNWLWDFGDGATSTDQNPLHIYAAPGRYDVSLAVTSSSGGDTEIKVDYVRVNPTPPVSAFSAEPTAGPAPLVVSFTDLSTPGTSPITDWLWNFGDTESSTQQHPQHTYAAQGVYTVSLSTTNSTGSSTTTYVDYITVGPPIPPTAEFSALPVGGPAPLDVQFTDLSDAGSAPILSWSWDFGDGQTGNEPNPSHTYGVAGTHTVALTVTTVVASSTKLKAGYITVDPPVPPTAAFEADRTSVYEHQQVQFTDLSSPGSAPIISWSWDFGDGGASASKNPSHAYTLPGVYTVALTVTTAVDSDEVVRTDYITVEAGIGPTAAFSADPLIGHTPLAVQFTDASSPGTSPITMWRWDYDDGDLGFETNPIHVFGTPGTYQVTLTVTTPVASDEAGPLSVTVLNPIVFVRQPEAQRRYEGEAVTFSVEAANLFGIVHYQWWHRIDEGSVSPVGTGLPTMTLNLVGPADEGLYWCAVSDEGGSRESDGARLDVAKHIEIVTNPVGADKETGETHVFSVETSGGFEPLSFQWYKDDILLADATQETLTLYPLGLSDSGSYWVSVADDHSDVVMSLPVSLLVVEGLRVGGFLTLLMLGAVCSACGALRLPRTHARLPVA